METSTLPSGVYLKLIHWRREPAYYIKIGRSASFCVFIKLLQKDICNGVITEQNSFYFAPEQDSCSPLIRPSTFGVVQAYQSTHYGVEPHCIWWLQGDKWVVLLGPEVTRVHVEYPHELPEKARNAYAARVPHGL